MVKEKITQVLHDVVRGYKLGLREVVENKYSDASDNEKNEYREFVGLVEANQDKKDPEYLHEAWLKTKLSQGYVFGTTEDVHIKTSPLLVRFKDLPLEQRTKYYVIRATVASLLTALST